MERDLPSRLVRPEHELVGLQLVQVSERLFFIRIEEVDLVSVVATRLFGSCRLGDIPIFSRMVVGDGGCEESCPSGFKWSPLGVVCTPAAELA